MGKFNLCILLIIFINMLVEIQCADWCKIQEKYCIGFDSEHIGCNPNQIPKGNCQNIKIVEIDEKLKQVIVDSHNEKRNMVASGQFNKFPSASSMQQMSWDNELEHLSVLHVRNCQIQHDKCRATEKFHHAGQNLAMMGSTSGYQDKTDAVKKMITNWFDEYKNTPTYLVKRFESYTLHVIGHFTVMMREKNSNVGCGLISYETVDRNGNRFFNYMLTCDYADTNMLNQPIYDIGLPASRCRQLDMVRSPTFSNLCVFLDEEIITPNNTFESTTIKTIITSKITTRPTIKPSTEVNPINLNKLRLIILNGESAPTNMWHAVQTHANEIVKNCELSSQKIGSVKMFISSKNQDYQCYVHEKLKIYMKNLGNPIHLTYKLNQENMFHNFAIGNGYIGCLYITFDLSDNVLYQNNKNNPIKCSFDEEQYNNKFCRECKKFIVKCWREKNSIQNHPRDNNNMGQIKKAGSDFNNGSSQLFTNLVGTLSLLIIIHIFIQFN